MPMKKRRTLHRLRTITLLVQMPRKMAWRMPKVKYGWLTKPTRLVYVRRSVPLRSVNVERVPLCTFSFCRSLPRPQPAPRVSCSDRKLTCDFIQLGTLSHPTIIRCSRQSSSAEHRGGRTRTATKVRYSPTSTFTSTQLARQRAAAKTRFPSAVAS
jgi:hypothetical protein